MDLFNIDIPSGLASALTGIEKQFIMMRSSGSSIRGISKKLKKSSRTICDWNKKFAKEIIGIRNSEFCELQKRVIETKTLRLNFLKREFERVSKLLEKHKIDVNETRGEYNKYLELFIKLSDLMSSCESDILTVGVKFKDNIEPEISNLENEEELNKDTVLSDSEENNVTKNENSVFVEAKKEIVDNTELKPDGKQSKTNCNMKTPNKYELYRKTNIYKNKNKEAFP
jgi:hypothetical protein